MTWLGEKAPITVALKMDSPKLFKRGLSLGWCHTRWSETSMSFTLMMQEIATLRFQRSALPKDAMSCDINTIDVADESNKDCMFCNICKSLEEMVEMQEMVRTPVSC